MPATCLLASPATRKLCTRLLYPIEANDTVKIGFSVAPSFAPVAIFEANRFRRYFAPLQPLGATEDGDEIERETLP
jgi:hypothetical protein